MLTAIKASQSSRHLNKPMVGAIALTIAYLGSMLFLYLSPPPGVFEPTLLLPVFNTIFAGALPLAVAFIAFRSYLAGGPNNMLLMGCGLLSFGSSAILAGWLIGGTQGINLNVTIYNVGALLGAIFHALCIVTVFRYQTADALVQHSFCNFPEQ